MYNMYIIYLILKKKFVDVYSILLLSGFFFKLLFICIFKKLNFFQIEANRSYFDIYFVNNSKN